MDPIHLFAPTFRVEETLEEIRECLEKGWTGSGFKTLAFEDAWKRYTDLPHAHFLNSATAGLHLAVRVLKEHDGWHHDDEVISSPLTFISTNHVIRYEGLRPVFADVDEYLCLDPVSIEERLTSRTRAVMFVGLGGNTGQLDTVARLCRHRGLRLILDAAHMAGTRWHGRHVGREADAAIFSFQAVKNLPTADAGMVCFAEAAWDTEVRKWTWLGINKDTYSRTHDRSTYTWEYDVERTGFRYQGNAIMAAMGLVGLKYLDQDNAHRRKVSEWYDELLGESVEHVPIAPGCESSRHLYQVLVDRRDEVIQALNAQAIFPGVHYRENTAYQMYASAKGSCPRAEAASQRLLSLPLHVQLSHQDVKRVSRALLSAVLSSHQLP